MAITWLARANTIWRDFVTDGVALSGRWNPQKSDIRAWGTQLENYIAAGLQANQRKVTGSGDLPIVATDVVLNINVAAPIAIAVPASSTRSGLMLIFNVLVGSAPATLTPNAADLPYGINSMASLQVNQGQSFGLMPLNDGVNVGYSIT